MEREELISRFATFLREYKDDDGNPVYINKLRDLLTVVPKRSLTIDWAHLNSFDPEVAEELLQNPEEVIASAEDAIQIVLREELMYEGELKVHARFYNLPHTLLVKELGSEHINRLIQVEGIITRVSEVKPFVEKAVFVCKDCGNEMIRLQRPYDNLVKPTKCDACGSRNIELDVDKSRFINFQSFRLQDRPESLKGGQMPRFVDAILLDDLVDTALPGDRVLVTGVLRVILEQREKRPIFKKVLEVNHIEQLSKEIEELEISPEDEQKIRELAKRKDIVDAIVDSIAPAIWGHKTVKKGIALALFGGVQRTLPDGTKLRGESHVLLVGDPGVAKCVDYDTKVVLADGSIRPIGELVNEAIEKAKENGSLGVVDDGYYAPIDLELYALDASTLKARKVKANIAWKRTAPERMFRIKTASGREIRVTPTHPFFVFEDGQFKTRKAEELKVGDFIAVPRVIPTTGKPVNLKKAPIQKPKTAKSRLVLPEVADEEFWYVIGLIAGEGHTQKRGSSATLYFTNNEKELIERVHEYLSRIGLNPTVRNSHKGKAASEVYASSIELYNLLEWLGIASNSAEKRVPPQLFSARNEDIKAFLRGYFDAEGTVDRGRPKITVVSASKELLKGVQHLLLRFGIKSQFHETESRATNGKMKEKKVYYRLFITGEDAVKFRDIIGFGLQKKMEVLREVTQGLKPNTNVDVVPSLSELLREARMKAELTQKDMGINRSTYLHYERGDRLPSREKLMAIVQTLKTHLPNSDEVRLLELLADSDIFWDRVEEIEEYKPEHPWVYDLQVPEHHNFIANDIFVHNSQLLRYVANLAPRAIYTSGKSSSAAGLTAAAVRDEFTGSWVLEAGVLVLADGGFACLHPDSRVLVDGKYQRIEDLFELQKSYKARSGNEIVDIQEKNMEVVALDLSTMKTRKSTATIIRRKPWKGDLIRLKLRSGNEITLTPDHLLIDGNTLEWKEAEKFKVGDKVIAPLKLPSTQSKVYILDILPENWKVKLTKKEKEELKEEILKHYGSLAEFNRKYNVSRDFLSGKSSITVGTFRKILKDLGIYETWRERSLTYGPNYHRERLKVPYITPELAYFMGFLYGDGWTSKHGSKVHVRIVQSKVHKEQIERIRKVFRAFYNGELMEYERKTKSEVAGNKVESESITFHVGSPLLAFIYEYLTEDNLKNAFSLDDEALKAFIAGALDSDGCVSVKNSKRGKVVHIEFLLSDDVERDRAFAMLLRRFDVYAKVTPGKGVNRIQITSREDVENLLNAVRDYSVKIKVLPEKKHLVSSYSDKIPTEPMRKLAKEILDSVPATVLQKTGLWSTIYAYAHRKYAPSRIQVRKIIERIGHLIPSETLVKLKVLATRDYFLDEIVSIERVSYEGHVYDLYVPGEHNFIAEGIIVHNCIDEFDKMSDRDRSAIHEALEQQSYHHDFELLLADGRKVKIGELVDELIEKNRDKVILGKDTEILPVDDIELLAYDLEKKEIVKVKADRVSRHKAPERFIKLRFSNGREITVTPEHPVMVWENGKITEKPAEKVSAGDLALAVKYYPQTGHKTLDTDTARLIGFLLSEGFSYSNPKNGYYEVGFTNTDESLVEEFKAILQKMGVKYGIQTRKRPGERKLYTVRVISKDFYQKLKREFPEAFPEGTDERPARRKRVPMRILAADENAKRAFLSAFFKGDGFVDRYRVGLTTSSRSMAEDLQDLLLSLGIYSYIFEEKRENTTYYKVVVSGTNDIERFLEIVSDDSRAEKIRELLKTSRKKRNYRDVLPMEVAVKLREVLNELHINDGRITSNIKRNQNVHRETVIELIERAEKRITEIQRAIEKNDIGVLKKFVTLKALSERLGAPYSTVLYRLKRGHEESVDELIKMASEKLERITNTVEEIKGIAKGNLRFLRILKVEELPNDHWEWVYDVTVEPHHLFVSHGLVLHNTISISKAGITATLNARTTVIAAANPKFGRFNRMKSLPEQLDLPPTLLSRFDLIFLLLDEPDEKIDSNIAEHILKVRRGEAEAVTPKIPYDLLKKYIAYARKNVHPVLSREAMEEIKNYYVRMRRGFRRKGDGEEGIQPIPITARQLEALIRLSEAHARMRLSETVTREDARAAIQIMEEMLRTIAVDEEGMVDAAILEVGKSTKKLNKIEKLLDIIKSLESEGEFGAPEDRVVEAARQAGLGTESDIKKLLNDLKREARIYEPRAGFYRVL